MKTLGGLLASLILAACATAPAGQGAAELFSVHADLHPGGRSLDLRVVELHGELAVEESAPGKRSKAKVAGPAADALRARIAALRISQADVDALGAREVGSRNSSGEEVLMLAPFDGVDYRFTIRSPAGLRTVAVSNPESDVHFQGESAEAKRMKELMGLLQDVTRTARGEIQ